MSLYTAPSDHLSCLTAPTIEVPHCFTTRKGGVSQGYLASMNIGTHRGDAPENVMENYRILSAALGFDPRKLVLSHQKHTDTVMTVNESHWGAGLTTPELPVCDALITAVPGTTLVVFSADCTPILLHDPVTGAVGAAHAGWRGTAQDIAGKTVKAMVNAFGCRPEDICAAIGPNIAQCCFETRQDVPDALLQTYGNAVGEWIQQQGDKYYVNLKAINAHSLRCAGVRCIHIDDRCTACQSDLFWSHRKTGDNRGSQGALIQCV